MLAATLAAVTAELLHSACTEGWSESATLEFKRDTPGVSDRDKHELLKDVSALANADGGDLVFGVNEVDGVASSLAPILNESADVLERRLSQVLDAGLEPRIHGLRWHRVDIEEGYVVVLRVPASFRGPHSIKVNQNRRFVMRNGTGTSDLTFEQLRMAFDRTASLSENARNFINARTLLLSDGKGAKRIVEGPIRVLHFVPLVGLGGRQHLDVSALYGDMSIFNRLVEADWGTAGRSCNLDGLVAHPGGAEEDGYYSYIQAFRNGAFEAASLAGGTQQTAPNQPAQRIVWSLDMTKWFRERSEKILALSRTLGFSGPAIVSFSALGVDGYVLSHGSVFGRRLPTSDRSNLIAPEVWIENLETAVVDDFVQPLLDTLWQGFGLARCLDYDATTKEYKPRKG